MTGVVKFTAVFEDGTEQVITVGEIDPEEAQTALSALKARVINFNQNIGVEGSDYEDYPSYMVSKGGANWKKIGRVQLVITERDYIF